MFVSTKQHAIVVPPLPHTHTHIHTHNGLFMIWLFSPLCALCRRRAAQGHTLPTHAATRGPMKTQYTLLGVIASIHTEVARKLSFTSNCTCEIKKKKNIMHAWELVWTERQIACSSDSSIISLRLFFSALCILL